MSAWNTHTHTYLSFKTTTTLYVTYFWYVYKYVQVFSTPKHVWTMSGDWFFEVSVLFVLYRISILQFAIYYPLLKKKLSKHILDKSTKKSSLLKTKVSFKFTQKCAHTILSPSIDWNWILSTKMESFFPVLNEIKKRYLKRKKMLI